MPVGGSGMPSVPTQLATAWEANVDVIFGRVGVQGERNDLPRGTVRLPTYDLYGRVAKPGVSIDDILHTAGATWDWKPMGEFRGLQVDDGGIVGIDVALGLGVKAQLDFPWLV